MSVNNGTIEITERAGDEVTAAALCQRIDTAADAARRAVAGDPLRAVEYDRARVQAEQFAAADYQGEVPAMVAAWAINGRTPQQAADSILAEASAYTNALELLRTTRLAAKEQVRALMAANQVEQAQQLTDQTIASIKAAVAGIGNNA
ncbi:phage tail protein [Pseudomonas mendocina]|uniref:phage tail protein n=1 Tax=Ectopseudomonas mendocina TaxID=300 RepID=UPI0023D9AA42|nr:phage tail protein [Pseudomonas mendocina]MDF2073186.1 phage tail protein [Pseudomonas mendocina]